MKDYTPENHGRSWTMNEKYELVMMWLKKFTIKEISERLKRTERSIVMKLEDLSLDPYQFNQKPEDPKPPTFYMVFVEGQNSPKYKHLSEYAALREANRLAEETKLATYVLRSVCRVQIEVTTKVENYA